MDNQFTSEELQQFNLFCVREFHMKLDAVRSLVSSGLKLKARNARTYQKKVIKKGAVPLFILPGAEAQPPQIDYTEFEDRFPKVYSTGSSSSEYFSDKSK